MEFREIAELERGDVVKYIGPAKNRSGLSPGRLYTVKDVRPDGEEFVLDIGIRVGYSPLGKEWDISSYERVEAGALLKSSDYRELIEFALATNDRAWFHELCDQAFQEN